MPSSQRANSGRPPTSSVVVLPVTFSGDDAALVAAVREGRPGAKAEFFNRYVHEVERMLIHTLGFDRDFPDILQETYTRAYASLPTLNDPRALRQWLFGIAARTAHKVLRTRARRSWLRFFVDEADEVRHEPNTAGMDPYAARALSAVYDILERFPSEQRIAFTLRFIEAMELSEVAEVLGVSLSTAKRRIASAETRFVAAARQHAMLSDWLERGGRWHSQ